MPLPGCGVFSLLEIEAMHENAAPSLASYFESVFAPAVLKGTKAGTTQEYRKAVRRFVTWTGLDVRLFDVDSFLVERWQRSMILEGLAFKTAKAWSVYVRRIVRHGSPGHCLKREGKRPHEDKATCLAGLSEDELRAPQRALMRFLEDVYVPRRMLGCKPGSVDQLRWTVSRFGKFLGRPPLLDDLNNECVGKFMAWILNVRGLSVSTANNSRKNLLSLWLYARKRGVLKSEPNDCEKLKQPRNLPSAWSIAEISRIIAASRQQTSPKLGMVYPAYVYFPALILVAYDTGLRLSALLGIKRTDFRPERREVTAMAEVQKQGVAQTFVVSEQTSEALQRMLAEPHIEPDEPPMFLFHWPLRKDAIHEHFRTILKRAGLYDKGDNTWHKMRRSCATHLTAALGIEAASRQLGHSSVEMTRRYVDPRQTGHHNAADHLPRPK